MKCNWSPHLNSTGFPARIIGENGSIKTRIGIVMRA